MGRIVEKRTSFVLVQIGLYLSITGQSLNKLFFVAGYFTYSKVGVMKSKSHPATHPPLNIESKKMTSQHPKDLIHLNLCTVVLHGLHLPLNEHEHMRA